mmetsp:Transcript_59564/g.69607  ORF Transcript_59564/g.69607 Transcript_59564/m.69607 type:complete len:637 (+) Transcript_59564:347-2257(+)
MKDSKRVSISSIERPFRSHGCLSSSNNALDGENRPRNERSSYMKREPRHSVKDLPPISRRKTRSQTKSIKKHGIIPPLSPKTDEILCCDLKELPDMSPDQTIDVNISKGLKEFQTFNYESSVKRFNVALKRSTTMNNMLATFVRGLCHGKLNNIDLALKDFTNCCTMQQTGSVTNLQEVALSFFNRGVILGKKRKMGRAIADFSKAISLYGYDSDFYANRALIHRRLGDYVKAQEDYQSVKTLQAENICARDNGSNTERLPSLSPSVKAPKKSPAFKRASPVSPHKNKKHQLPSPKHSERRASVKERFFGLLHEAITCRAEERSAEELRELVNESKMMSAFAHLKEDQLLTLWKYLEYELLPSNHRIFEQGDDANHFYLIWKGRVSARLQKETMAIKHAYLTRAMALETEVRVNIMTAGESLGEAVIDGGIRKAACVTEEPTELLVLKREHFDLTFKVFLNQKQEEKISFLSDVKCFSHWKADECTAIAKPFREQKYSGGEIIVEQNSIADSFHVIKSGLVSVVRKVHHAKSGKSYDVCVSKLCSGDVFGESCLLEADTFNSTFPSSIFCDTPQVVCFRLDRNQIKANLWDWDSKQKLREMAVNYPDDSVLLRAQFESNKMKRSIKRARKRSKRCC